MLKKRVIIFGLIGAMTAGFGFAGCAGASGVADSTETESVAETIETDAVVAESTFNEVETETADDLQTKAVERDGKYIYTILDGRVEVPLEHRVENYIEYGKTLENDMLPIW